MEDAIASSSSDGIKTWSVSTNQTLTPRSQLRGGTGGAAECVRFNHNGQVLVGAGTSGVITLWHTNGTVLGELSRKQDHGKTIRALSFSSGSRYLATGGDDAVVKVWDLKRREVIRTFRGHKHTVECIQFSKDADKYVASGDEDGDICLFNVLTGRLAMTLSRPQVGESRVSTSVHSISFSAHQKNLLTSAHDDGELRLWDIASSSADNGNALVASIRGAHEGAITSVCCSPVSSDVCVSVGIDKHVNVYDLRTVDIVSTAKADTSLLCCEHFADGNRVVVGTARGELMIYDIRRMGQNSHPVSRVTAHERLPVTSVQVQPGIGGDGGSDTASVRSERSVQSIRSDISERNNSSARNHRSHKSEMSSSSRTTGNTANTANTTSVVSAMPHSVSVFGRDSSAAVPSSTTSSSTTHEFDGTSSSSRSATIGPPFTANVPPSSVRSTHHDIVPTPAAPTATITPHVAPHETDDALDEATSLEEQIRNLLEDQSQKTAQSKRVPAASIAASRESANGVTAIPSRRVGGAAADPGTSDGNLSIATPPSTITPTESTSAPMATTTTIKKEAIRASAQRVTTVQDTAALRDMMEEMMGEHRSEIRSDIQNVHVELLRQFQVQIVRVSGGATLLIFCLLLFLHCSDISACLFWFSLLPFLFFFFSFFSLHFCIVLLSFLCLLLCRMKYAAYLMNTRPSFPILSKKINSFAKRIIC